MQTELLPEIKSRPVYRPVSINDRAALHLFVAESVMPDELEALLGATGSEHSESLVAANSEQACALLQPLMNKLPLATSAYLAGSEAFMWAVATLLQSAGMHQDQIQMLKPESKTRQVFCCHCYSLTTGVSASPASCSGCQRLLAVTDHFSRRHGAYLGFQINAEDPADLPAAEELS